MIQSVNPQHIDLPRKRVVSLQVVWLNLIRRLAGLPVGEHVLSLTVKPDGVSWRVASFGGDEVQRSQ